MSQRSEKKGQHKQQMHVDTNFRMELMSFYEAGTLAPEAEHSATPSLAPARTKSKTNKISNIQKIDTLFRS